MSAKSKAARKAGTAGKRKRKTAKSGKDGATRSRAEPKLPCPIVGIGGSAGGFEAARELLEHLPGKTGMAFAIVQHLDPHHDSRLASLLGHCTKMRVVEVTGTTVPEPDTVY